LQIDDGGAGGKYRNPSVISRPGLYRDNSTVFRLQLIRKGISSRVNFVDKAESNATLCRVSGKPPDMQKFCLSLGVAALVSISSLSHAEQPVIDLPQIGNPADLAISPAEEIRIGRQVASELYYYNYVVEDPELTEYLASVGWRLAANGGESPPSFEFLLIADPRINAFALPGAYIGVNAGLLLAAASESELASVMAHEEAHVTQRHAARSANEGEVATIATWLAVLAAIIAGSANPNVVIGALSIGQGINYNRQVSYTRANEYEADRIGIRTLAASGFDPNAMAGFFAKLEQQTRLYGNQLPEILLTHPINTTRVAEAQERAAQYPHRDIVDSVDFSLMHARIRTFIADSANDSKGYFTREIEVGNDTPENRYGLALSLEQLEQHENAMAALAPLVKEYPKQVTINLLQAQILTGLGKTNEALDLYAKTLSVVPRYAPAIFAYSEALIAANKPDEARQLLLTHEQALGKRNDTYRLLSSAARASGRTAEAQYQQALYLSGRGDLVSALQQLNAGLRVASITAQDRARLSAKRQELLETIPRDELRKLQRQPG
jgi:beta-barrel assembly-enhancing protease